MKKADREREEAITRLREWITPGDTLYCVLRSCSRSGMSRIIDLQGFKPTTTGELQHFSYGYNAALALGWGYDRKREGVKVGGCGMDMGFHLVYSLSSVLFPNGYGCLGQGKRCSLHGDIGPCDSCPKCGNSLHVSRGPSCPASDHSNGDRDYTVHQGPPMHWDEERKLFVCDTCTGTDTVIREGQSVPCDCTIARANVHPCPGCKGTGKETWRYIGAKPEVKTCRTCHGKKVCTAQHWHGSGGYALQHRWV
jgi:hypothetical protein